MRKLLLGILTASFLSVPIQAQYNTYRGNDGRYYDRDRRDYHAWNDGEAKAWHRYWAERHRREIAWERANERQKRDYWKWRHEHRD